MRYLGGKFRIRKQVSSILKDFRKPGQPYVEPFVGGASILSMMDGERTASDLNPHLICMYEQLQLGWIPPDHVSEDTYNYYREFKPDNDPMTAFCGIGCSFGGKWFGGYARSGSRNYALNAANSLNRLRPLIKDVFFTSRGYREINPKNCLIYCDPPYKGTTALYGGPFNHDIFWGTMRIWSLSNDVLISEYVAPDDFECVLEIPTKTDMRVDGGKETRIEKVFRMSY